MIEHDIQKESLPSEIGRKNLNSFIQICLIFQFAVIYFFFFTLLLGLDKDLYLVVVGIAELYLNYLYIKPPPKKLMKI